MSQLPPFAASTEGLHETLRAIVLILIVLSPFPTMESDAEYPVQNGYDFDRAAWALYVFHVAAMVVFAAASRRRLWLRLHRGPGSQSIRAFQYAPASRHAPFGYPRIAVATAIGYLVFDNLPDRWTILGALLIIASGLYLAYRGAIARRLGRIRSEAETGRSSLGRA